MDPATRDGCLDAETLAAYVEGRVGTDDKQRAERHIDQCGNCRAELSALVRAMPTEEHGMRETEPAPRPSSMLKTGDSLGPYEIVELVGSGGMGTVYRARDQRLGRDVALKILPADVRNDPDARQRFKREARAVGSLNHPNVLVVYDVEVDAAMPYVVTELLAGMTLRKRLELRPLSPREVSEYGVQIARGLVAAHDKGIIHRDLKPENLFLTTDGTIKILDFGLAKRLPVATERTEVEASIATIPGAVMGTAGYMSPEQVLGDDVDARTDIFSLGVVLFELASGRRPFEGATFGAICAAILHHEPPALAELCSEPVGPLAGVIERCLAKRPDERYASARDVLSALSGSSPGGRAATPLPVAQPRSTRNWSTVALVLAIPVAFAAAWIARGTPTERAPVTTGVRWPSLVEGGPEHIRVTYHAQNEWFARFASDGASVVYSMRDRGGLHVMRSEIGRPSVLELGLAGRVLDVARDGTVAVQPDSPDQLLAVGMPGAGSPRELARDVEDASFGTRADAIAITRHAGSGAVIEYPIGHPILRRDNVDFPSVRVSRDGKRLAVIEWIAPPDTRGHVVVLDADGHELGRSQDYSSIEGIAWSPDDREVWASSLELLRAFAPGAPDRVLFRSTGYLMLRDVAADGRILVAPFVPHVLALAGPARAPSERIGWLDGSHIRAISDDGSELALVHAASSGTAEGYPVFVRRNADAPVELGRGFDVALAPDGSFAVLLCGTGDHLRRIPIGPGTTKPIRIDPVATFDLSAWIQISTDGQRVYARGAAPGKPMRLWAFDMSGANPAHPIGPETVAADASEHFAFAVSPDEAWIAIPAADGVRLIPAAGGDGARALSTGRAAIPLRFAHDGAAVFTWAADGWPRTIDRVDLAAGSKPAVVATLAPPSEPYSARAVVNADGRVVAFSYVDLATDLYVLAPPRVR